MRIDRGFSTLCVCAVGCALAFNSAPFLAMITTVSGVMLVWVE